MKADIDKIKLNTFKDQAQITFFRPDGTLVGSCHTLVQLNPEQSLYDQFVFLESLREVFQSMTPEDEYDFPAVEWEEGAKGLYHLHFKLAEEEGLVQWTLIDKSKQYEQLLQLQQGRNENAISEEFATIQQKVAEMERQLVEYQNEELKRVQDFKTEFFAKVSHEMRTPLNSISGLVALLMEDERKAKEYLPALQATSRHLNSIINDILDLSKIDVGKLSFESLDFEVVEAVTTIMKGFEYEASEKGVSLNLTVPETPIFVKADPTRIAQVLYNLLGNSLKFTEKGYVSLTLTTIKESDSHYSIDFKVEDTGIGMDPDKIEALLEPYRQAEDKTTRLYGGTGLGLHVAVKLVEAMGSQLEITSALAQGTKMSFTLVLEKGNEQIAHQHTGMSLSGFKLLLAEDDPVNMHVLKELCLKAGAEDVQTATDGDELEAALNADSFDLVITDVNLPGQTGIEAFSGLRAKGIETPFLFISGDDLRQHEVLDTLTGWGFVMKPLNITDLLSQFEELLPKKFPTELNLSNLKDMIAGDMAFFKDLIQTILETLPQELSRLNNAVDARDSVTSGKVLHKIRPSIDYLGIPQLSKERHWLHNQAEDDKIDEEYLARIADFDTWVKQVLKKLEKEI